MRRYGHHPIRYVSIQLHADTIFSDTIQLPKYNYKKHRESRIVSLFIANLFPKYMDNYIDIVY